MSRGSRRLRRVGIVGRGDGVTSWVETSGNVVSWFGDGMISGW